MLSAAAVVLAGAFGGGFVSGLAGFGTGLVALGIWLHVLDPALAVTLVVICSVVSQAQTISTVWRAIDRARVWPMILAGLVGIPVGALLLEGLDPAAFRLAVGILLLTFSGFLLLGHRRPQLAWGGRPADAAVGFAGGVLGGLAGLSGPLPTVWATLRGWSKDERRGLFQSYNLAILGAVLAWQAAAGLLTAEVGRLALVALPGTLAGSWLGAAVYRRLSHRGFDRVVLALLALSGASLVWTNLGRL